MTSHETIMFDTTDLADLGAFLEGTTGPYASAVIPAPSALPDAAERLGVAWGRLRRDLSADFSAEVLDRAEVALSAAGHGGGDSIALVIPSSGDVMVEHLAGSPTSTRFVMGPLPAFTAIVEHRQRTIAHLVVECDLAGAEVIAFDGGDPIAADHVEGEVLHIHRGHPGGWSQRRFQQRAENTWESNIDDVADAVCQMVDRVGARLVAVAGPTRAQSMLVSALTDRGLGDITRALESGSVDGIADEVVRLTDDVHARTISSISEAFGDRQAQSLAVTGADDVVSALAEGRVESLLVVDDWTDDTELRTALSGIEPGARLVDAAIAASLTTGAGVTVVPTLASLDGATIAAFLRW